MRQLLFTCLLVFSSFAVQAQQPTAPDILKTAAAAYSGCHSYSDEGMASFKPVGLSYGAGPSQASFRTAFVSPNRFRFEVNGSGKSSWIVWTDGDVIKTTGSGGFLDRS